jgi:hypothetical protein
MEIESAARRYLLGIPEVAGYVGTRVFKFDLVEPLEGTGDRAVVVARQPGWRSPESVGTSEFPRLAVDCWADPTRVPDSGEIQTLDAADKAYALARVIRPWFCFPHLRNQWIGAFGSNPGLRVVDSEPRMLEGHPVAAGDMVAVRIEFSMTVMH